MANFLFITQLYPSGLSGTSVKTRHTIEYLLARGDSVDVYCIHHQSLVRPTDWQHPQLRIFVVTQSVMSQFSLWYVIKHLPLLMSLTPFRIKKMFAEQLAYGLLTAFESQAYDKIFFDGFSTLQYGEWLLQKVDQILHSSIQMRHNLQQRRWVYIDDEDITDLLLQRIKTTSNPVLKFFFLTEYFKSQHYERRVMPLTQQIWAISDRTAVRLKTLTVKKVVVMPTIVPTRKSVFSIKSHDLVFTGLLSWLENINGLKWFIVNVWPQVLSQFPQTKLHVIGQMAKPEFVAWLKSQPNIVYKGYVPDLTGVYGKAAGAIAPMLINCGIKVKVVTYLSYGIPVISTEIGTWGLTTTEGVLTAQYEDEFANQVIELLKNTKLRQTLSIKALRNCRQHHSAQTLRKFFTTVRL